MNTQRRMTSLGAGLFFTSAAILMLEICLTRVFSVMMWYHFAFFTISVALFGFAAAGLTVHLKPKTFTAERALRQAGLFAALLAIAAPVCFSLLALNPKQGALTGSLTMLGELNAGLTILAFIGVIVLFVTAVLPFYFGGMILSIVFRHFGDKASRLYFWDLVGGGLGCLASILVLDWFGGPGSMAFVSVLAAIAGVLFLSGEAPARQRNLMGVLVVVAALLALTNNQTRILDLKYYRGQVQDDVVFEDWNSFSRVAVRDGFAADSLLIEIDAASNTFAARWDGDRAHIRDVAEDLISLQYVFLEHPKILAIGSGGGTDLLAGLAAGSTDITGVEVNPIIVHVMREEIADYTGGIYHQPEVRIVNDEARSYIRRSEEKFDCIQAGYVDTYAATAAGAFALTENTLYTVEAYHDYLDHLTDDGIVAFQRYYEENPQQGVRLVTVAMQALLERGVKNVGRHIVVARKWDRATVLVKKSPFTAEQVDKLIAHCEANDLILVAAPGHLPDDIYGRLLATDDMQPVLDAYDLDISPVYDDRPFFFYVIRPAQFWKGLLLRSGEFQHARAVFLLISLLILVTVVSLLVFVLPAFFHRHLFTRKSVPALAYFGALGLGFMLVEIGMLQRMMLFLGHPTLALSVVLSTILISAGLGSAWSGRIPDGALRSRLTALLGVVLVLVIVAAFVWGPLLTALIHLPRAGRVMVAIAFLFPLGFFLGTAFPLGLRRLAGWNPELIPWAWAVNGATSVLGSVLAMAVAINSGFTVVLLIGGAVYLIGLLLAQGETA